MLSFPDDGDGRPGDVDGVARRSDSKKATPSQTNATTPARIRNRIECEIRDGMPTVRGKAPAYYLTGPGAGRMLIIERRAGERIRINSTTEVVVLDVGPESIRIAIETVSQDEDE